MLIKTAHSGRFQQESKADKANDLIKSNEIKLRKKAHLK